MLIMHSCFAGIWFINWEILCVATACLFLWADIAPMNAAVGTVVAVIASRIGLWGFDLSAQILVQEVGASEMSYCDDHFDSQ